MTARENARAAKLRRVSEADFAQEADRRGYVKASPKVVPMPRRLLTEHAAELTKRGMHMIEEPEQAVNDLRTVRAMVTTAGWIKTFIEVQDHNMVARGLVAAE